MPEISSHWKCGHFWLFFLVRTIFRGCIVWKWREKLVLLKMSLQLVLCKEGIKAQTFLFDTNHSFSHFNDIFFGNHPSPLSCIRAWPSLPSKKWYCVRLTPNDAWKIHSVSVFEVNIRLWITVKPRKWSLHRSLLTFWLKAKINFGKQFWIS